MHRLTNLTALNDQRRLHAFTYTDQVMVHGADGQKARYSGVLLVDVAIGKDDVVYTLVHTLLSLLTKVVESLTESLFAFRNLEEHR